MNALDKVGMGDRIKQIRKRAGLRQWQLAQMLGTTQSAVHKYEHGVIPEPRRLIEMSRLGETTIEWILTGHHWENGSERQDRPSVDVYRLAERLREFGPDEHRTLEEAMSLIDQAVVAVRTSGAEGFEPADLEKPAALLQAARRVHRAVVDTVLDQARERLDAAAPPVTPSAQNPAPEPRRR